MLLTLALLILCTAIVALFSDEFSGVVKRFFKIPGAILFVPLLLSSLVVSNYEYLIWIILRLIHGGFRYLEQVILSVLPGISGMVIVARVVVLTVVACTPIVISQLLKKKHVINGSKITLQRIAVFGWLVAAILFVTIKN